MVDYVDLNIDDLLLDEENPRLGSVKSQSAALEAIIHLDESHFRNLMLSVKENGLDPGDNLYVIEAEEGPDFTVLEGNRRLSALMVLSNPDVLSGTEVPEKTKKSLIRVSAGFDRSIVEPIRCVKFARRSDAHDWIFRRHTGSAEGEGRIQWGPLEIQRFSGDRSILDVIDFVGRNADYTNEEWESTKSIIESKKSSNLDRMLNSAPGRKHLAITTQSKAKEKTPLLGSDPKWALNVLRRVIDDVRDGIINSRTHNKASEIEDYFKDLPEELQPKKNKGIDPQPFREIDIKKRLKTAAKKTSSQQKTKSAPRPRTTLAPKRHPFHAPNSTKGEQLLREAGTLDANRFTVSSAFVLRSFIELAINDYMHKSNLPRSEKQDAKGHDIELDLTQKADRVVKHIVGVDRSKNADLRLFRSLILTKTSATSIQSLNGFVHNKFQIPTADSLRAAWDCSVPIFIAAYGSV